MERFKVCEKETKTKAFSKEGLGQAAKLDPREKKRSDIREWLSTVVGRLNEDVRLDTAALLALWSLPGSRHLHGGTGTSQSLRPASSDPS